MKVKYEKAVVWVERTPAGPFLVIKVAGRTATKIDLARVGSLFIGARYKVLVGDIMAAYHQNGITGTEPEPTE